MLQIKQNPQTSRVFGGFLFKTVIIKKMRVDGIEPSTTCLKGRCSTPELHPHNTTEVVVQVKPKILIYIHLSNFILNKTTSLIGLSGQSDWDLSLSNGNYTWNCLAYDSEDNFDWDVNRTVFINYTAPDYFPTWSLNDSNIVSTYSPSTLSYFNITWSDTSLR